MAENLQDIKRRIKSVQSTEHVTNAMKLVSTAKLRVAKKKYETMNVNLVYVAQHIASIFRSAENVPERYIKENEGVGKTCYIVVGSSKGFCGGYNSSIIKKVEELIEQSDKDAVILAFGSKVGDYFRKHPRAEVIAEYLDPPEDMDFDMSKEFVSPAMRMFRDYEVDKIVMVYTAFENLIKQTVRAQVMLPISMDYITDMHDEDEKVEELVKRDIEFLPGTNNMFNYLVIKYFEIDIMANVIEAVTCEHTSRRVAMENATDNANEMLDGLSMSYNRARQAAITSEITEIVAGNEALK